MNNVDLEGITRRGVIGLAVALPTLVAPYESSAQERILDMIVRQTPLDVSSIPFLPVPGTVMSRPIGPQDMVGDAPTILLNDPDFLGKKNLQIRAVGKEEETFQ